MKPITESELEAALRNLVSGGPAELLRKLRETDPEGIFRATKDAVFMRETATINVPSTVASLSVIETGSQRYWQRRRTEGTQN